MKKASPLRNVPFALLFAATLTAAEEPKPAVISGQLIDALTGRPVAGADVFLAGTTIGDACDSAGYYLLPAVPPGNYTLVAAHIGYDTRRQNIRTVSGEKSIYNFALSPRVIELPAVQVQALRDAEWRRQLKRFEQEFLGTSANAASCRLLNPQVMRLFLDDEELYAYSSEPLEIIHERFGYHIRAAVISFRLKDDRVSYEVLSYYQPLEAKDKQQAARWAENRRAAYDGSFRHFFHALFSRRLEAESFDVEQVEDPRPFSPTLERITSQNAVGNIFSDTDFALFKKVHFKNYLRIRRSGSYAQTSFLQLPFDTLQVDWAGNSTTDAEIIRSGYWGEKRFGDELPTDYLP